MDWAFSASGDTALGLALTLAAVPIWIYFSLFGECRKRVEAAIAVLPGLGDALNLEMQLQEALAISLLHSGGAVAHIQVAWERAFKIAGALNDENICFMPMKACGSRPSMLASFGRRLNSPSIHSC